MSDPKAFDVVIIGASLCGLSAGAILANRGYKVAVVDPINQPGGRLGAVNYNGYWINWGHRDGEAGIGDLSMPTDGIERVEKAADIVIPKNPDGFGAYMRIHTIPDRGIIDVPNAAISGGMVDEMAMYRGMVGLFSDIQDLSQVELVAKQVKDALTQLRTIDDDAAWSLVPVTLGDWCDRQGFSLPLRTVLCNYLEASASSPGEDASIGRFIFHLRNHINVSGTLEDDEVGGMQTAVMGLMRAVRAKGGEVWLGWKPREITIEDMRVCGVVATNDANLIQEFETAVVIDTNYGWNLSQLIDERLLPKIFLERARDVERYATDAASWVAGCRRMPKVRSTGEVEDFRGWQRITMCHGTKRSYFGGFHWPSMLHRHTAPEGKHLIMVTVPHTGNENYGAWKDAKTAVDKALNYVRNYYLDLDDVIEWSKYQWVGAPQVLTWYLKPIYRHPIKVSTIQGLYSPGSTSEGKGAWVDIECLSALETVNLVESEWGAIMRSQR